MDQRHQSGFTCSETPFEIGFGGGDVFLSSFGFFATVWPAGLGADAAGFAVGFESFLFHISSSVSEDEDITKRFLPHLLGTAFLIRSLSVITRWGTVSKDEIPVKSQLDNLLGWGESCASAIYDLDTDMRFDG